MKKMRILLGLLLSFALITAMTSCGSKDEPAEETGADTQTEEQAETEVMSEEYDIASNLKETVSDNTKTIETDHFTLTLSLPDTWNYEQNSSTSITFYNIAGREADCGGRLMTLIAYDPDDDSYKGFPHYSVVGESGDKIYVAEYPSDVQADMEVEEHMEQYQIVYAEINKIEAGAEDSPLVLK